MGRLLRTYFYSGWAFLIPYLALYLLYYWMKWPANPASGVVRVGSESESGHALIPHSLTPPPLLYVYWAFHAIHLGLAAIALRSWWRDALQTAISGKLEAKSSLERGTRNEPLALAVSFKLCALRSAASAVAPWALLALIFAIPGVYLEWPSDPWEHLRRITEWATVASVNAHSTGYKAFYFFGYSCVGRIPAAIILSWLNIFYTGVSLLVGWQYYRLGKTVGLNGRCAFVFVLVNVLTLGNVCFSFYRYYGLASTTVSQLAAVAMIRIALETVVDPGFTFRSFFRIRARSFFTGGLESKPPLVWVILSVTVCLSALIVFNHIQGLGIAALGIAAVCGWKLVERKRSYGWWLGGMALGLSVVAVLWLPPDQPIAAYYRSAGWLNQWYGFNIFSWSSPAADRAVEILGLTGLLDLAAAIVLLRTRHVAGWLTLAPIVALTLPCVALPFAQLLATRNATEIITFHRVLFGIPSGLALVTLVHNLDGCFTQSTMAFRQRISIIRFTAFVVAIGAALVLPSTKHYYGRIWHVISRPPDDLTMRITWNGIARYALSHSDPSAVRLAAMSSTGFLVNTQHAAPALTAYRLYSTGGGSPAYDARAIRDLIAGSERYYPTDLILLDPTAFVSAYSTAALMSGHWPQQEASLAAMGTPEFKKLVTEQRWLFTKLPAGTAYRRSRMDPTER